MPSTRRSGVDRAVPKRRLPVWSSKTAMSVNVPPISAARRRFEPLARDGVRGFILSVGDRGEGIAAGVRRAQLSATARPACDLGWIVGAGLCSLGRLDEELGASLEATPTGRGQAEPCNDRRTCGPQFLTY